MPRIEYAWVAKLDVCPKCRSEGVTEPRRRWRSVGGVVRDTEHGREIGDSFECTSCSYIVCVPVTGQRT